LRFGAQSKLRPNSLSALSPFFLVLNIKKCYFLTSQKKMRHEHLLTPQLEKIVKAKIASGLYGSASEVMREALSFWMRGATSGSPFSSLARGDSQRT
jgi:hypothetical protein